MIHPSKWPQTLDDLMNRLMKNQVVLGILRYGSNAAFERQPGGDLDLFVIVEQRPDDVESLHFHVGEIPVDLNVRALDDLDRQPLLTDIDDAICDAEVLFDRDGRVTASIKGGTRRIPPPLTLHDTAWNRFCQQHLIDKVRGRLHSQPLLCSLLLNTNIYWLIQTYFRVRCLPYSGEKNALNWLQTHDSTLYAQIEAFYATQDLATKLKITIELTERVLEPLGGPWQQGEILTFGRTPEAADLPNKGETLFKALFLD